eukprot:gene14812-17506_t
MDLARARRETETQLPEYHDKVVAVPKESLREAVGIGFTLSMSNLAGGVASGMSADASLGLMTLTAFGFSY